MSQPDLGDLLRQAQMMQEQLLAAQAEAAEQVLVAEAGGGSVRIEVTGGGEFRAVHIDPAAVDPAEVDLLEDLILAALHDATAKVHALTQQAVGGVLPGGGLGGLGGLLGG